MKRDIPLPLRPDGMWSLEADGSEEAFLEFLNNQHREDLPLVSISRHENLKIGFATKVDCERLILFFFFFW